MRKKYRSKTKTILLYNLVGSVAIAIPLGILGYCIDRFEYLISGAFAMLLTPIILAIPTYYIIDNNTLIVRQSFIKMKIDITTIKWIKVSNDNHDIKIRYKKYSSVDIYPKDKSEFINDLKGVNSEIEVKYK